MCGPSFGLVIALRAFSGEPTFVEDQLDVALRQLAGEHLAPSPSMRSRRLRRARCPARSARRRAPSTRRSRGKNVARQARRRPHRSRPRARAHAAMIHQARWAARARSVLRVAARRCRSMTRSTRPPMPPGSRVGRGSSGTPPASRIMLTKYEAIIADGDGERERHEELLREPREEEHGQEHGDRRERRREHRERDGVRALRARLALEPCAGGGGSTRARRPRRRRAVPSRASRPPSVKAFSVCPVA